MSRGFICALSGVAMTLFSWYGPWTWPAWPALTVGRFIGGRTSVYELPYAQRVVVIVLLIAVNSAFWGGAAWGVWWSVQRLTTRRRRALPL
jgi:hypothetical protein